MKSIIVPLVFLLRLALCAMFVVSGVQKLLNPGSFLDSLQAFDILSYGQAFATMVVLPWLEILCGLALLTWRYSAAAALIMAGLTGTFIYFIRSAVKNGIDVDCKCFGDWVVFPNHQTHLLVLYGIAAAILLVFARTLYIARHEATIS